MAQAQFDILHELQAQVQQTGASTSTPTEAGTPIAHLNPHAWAIHIADEASGFAGSETYTWELQVSDLVGGTYVTVAQITYDEALQGVSNHLHIPVSGELYRAVLGALEPRFMQVVLTTGGASPDITWSSHLTKLYSEPGTAVDAQQASHYVQP